MTWVKAPSGDRYNLAHVHTLRVSSVTGGWAVVAHFTVGNVSATQVSAVCASPDEAREALEDILLGSA